MVFFPSPLPLPFLISFFYFLLPLLSASLYIRSQILCISGDQKRKDQTRNCLFRKTGDFLSFLCQRAFVH